MKTIRDFRYCPVIRIQKPESLKFRIQVINYKDQRSG